MIDKNTRYRILFVSAPLLMMVLLALFLIPITNAQSGPCTDPMTCNPVLAIPSFWRCDIPECSGGDWVGSVISWPSQYAYQNNDRAGNNSRTVYNAQGEVLYPYMGSWANGCVVTAVTGRTLIIEWQRGAEVWRETTLNTGQSHTISLVPPENGALIESIEGSPDIDFSVSLANCTPQAVLKTPTPMPTPTATQSPPVAFPSTGVLDTFNRDNGSLGSNWSGSTAGYQILSQQLRHVGTGEQDIYWNPASFGVDQEAFVTLANLDPTASEIGLVLKSQSSDSNQSQLVVVYFQDSQEVEVWTYSGNWIQRGDSIPVVFVAGDQFGVRAKGNGQVEIFQNGNLLGVRSVADWLPYTLGGYIGLYGATAGAVVLDDFGGGGMNYSAPTATPSPTPTPTHTPTPVPAHVWTGSQNSNWNNTLNWQPAAVPGASDNVVIAPINLTGAGAWPALNADLTVDDLSLAAGAELTIPNGRSLTVNGVLTNNGLLRQTIDIQSASPVRFLHITGTGGVKYYGVDITPAGAMGPTTVEIRGNRLAGCNQGSQLIIRCFDIAPTTPQPATIRFWYLDGERNGESNALMKVYHWNAPGGVWNQLDAGGELRGSEGIYHYVEVDGVSAYSPFGLADGAPNSPTAVSLQSFGVGSANLVWGFIFLLFLFPLLAAGRMVYRRERAKIE